MSDQTPEQIAERLVADLFTNGAGERAIRLVLIDEQGRDLGGWSERGMASRIATLLDRATEDQPR